MVRHSTLRKVERQTWPAREAGRESAGLASQGLGGTTRQPSGGEVPWPAWSQATLSTPSTVSGNSARAGLDVQTSKNSGYDYYTLASLNVDASFVPGLVANLIKRDSGLVPAQKRDLLDQVD